MAVVATCHCGAVTLTVDTPPTEITECNCSICRRYGALWAYYPKGAVTFVPPEAATDTYLWDDRSIGFHRCRVCGCVTHWWPVAEWRDDRMGLNVRLMEPPVIAAARRRFLDGAVSEQYID